MHSKSVDSLSLTRAGFIEYFLVATKLVHALTAIAPALFLLYYPGLVPVELRSNMLGLLLFFGALDVYKRQDLASATAVTLHLRFAVDHFAPPASAGMRCLQVDPLAHHRRGNPHAVFGGQFEYPFERLVPGMHGQVEGAVVDRQQPAPAKIPVSLEGLLRVHVHVLSLIHI